MSKANQAVLQVANYSVDFFVEGVWYPAAINMNFEVEAGKVLAIVGESGSGKSTTAMGLMDLLASNARVEGSVKVNGVEMIGAKKTLLRRTRGRDVAYIFQEPMTALNPVYTIGFQIVETLRTHFDMGPQDAKTRAIELITMVEIPNPEASFDKYPHQLSGGQRQRAMIAQSLACDPGLLVADEPTTALDVTVQAEILDLIRNLRDRLNSAILLITHDMGVVADLADDILVMKDGNTVEHGTADQIFNRPQHPYTQELLAAVPKLVSSNLRIPVRIAFSHDEEIGCIGVKSLVEWLKSQPVRDELCIVGEPTDMRPVLGHKGGRAYRVYIEGREAHSSLAPHAVNAIDAAAELIIFLKQISQEMRNGPSDPDYDVPHGTLSVGLIKGGSAINIVPKSCEFVFEYRHLVGFDAQGLAERVFRFANETILPPMQALAPESSIRFEEIYSYPSLAIDPGHDAVSRVKAIAARNDDGKVAYGTEGGYFMNDLGIPTVVCGPGSITQAHTPDEFVFLNQLALSEAFIDRLIKSITP